MTDPSPAGMSTPVHVERVDHLRVQVYRDRPAMGRAAAERTAGVLGRKSAGAERVRVVFASAPSQNEFLAALAVAPVDWLRVEAFHMDEYVGVDRESPQAFSTYLREHLFGLVRAGRFNMLDGAADPIAEAKRYGRLLAAAPLALVCCGVGENGHLAFNDPGVADFRDPAAVKEVELSEESRRQQVHDRTFPDLEAVPRRALTVTIPTLLGARAVTCVVPGPTKRTALARLLRGPVSEECPASILRQHQDCVLYTDLAAFDGPASTGGESK